MNSFEFWEQHTKRIKFLKVFNVVSWIWIVAVPLLALTFFILGFVLGDTAQTVNITYMFIACGIIILYSFSYIIKPDTFVPEEPTLYCPECGKYIGKTYAWRCPRCDGYNCVKFVRYKIDQGFFESCGQCGANDNKIECPHCTHIFPFKPGNSGSFIRRFATVSEINKHFNLEEEPQTEKEKLQHEIEVKELEVKRAKVEKELKTATGEGEREKRIREREREIEIIKIDQKYDVEKIRLIIEGSLRRGETMDTAWNQEREKAMKKYSSDPQALEMELRKLDMLFLTIKSKA